MFSFSLICLVNQIILEHGGLNYLVNKWVCVNLIPVIYSHGCPLKILVATKSQESEIDLSNIYGYGSYINPHYK